MIQNEGENIMLLDVIYPYQMNAIMKGKRKQETITVLKKDVMEIPEVEVKKILFISINDKYEYALYIDSNGKPYIKSNDEYNKIQWPDIESIDEYTTLSLEKQWRKLGKNININPNEKIMTHDDVDENLKQTLSTDEDSMRKKLLNNAGSAICVDGDILYPITWEQMPFIKVLTRNNNSTQKQVSVYTGNQTLSHNINEQLIPLSSINDVIGIISDSNMINIKSHEGYHATVEIFDTQALSNVYKDNHVLEHFINRDIKHYIISCNRKLIQDVSLEILKKYIDLQQALNTEQPTLDDVIMNLEKTKIFMKDTKTTTANYYISKIEETLKQIQHISLSPEGQYNITPKSVIMNSQPEQSMMTPSL